MATIVKNVKKFSKIYVVNSDFNTTHKNLLYSVNLGAPEIKYAYYGNELIYNAEGSGYYLSAYLMSYDNPSTEKIFQANGEAKEAYITIHNNTYYPNLNFANPASNAWYSYDWTTGEKFRAYISSYYRNTSGNTTNITDGTSPIRLKYPRLNYRNTEIQHQLIRENDSVGVNFTNKNTYTYQYYTSNNTLLGNQKVWFNFFVPRFSYTTNYYVESNYGKLKRNSPSVTNIKVNIYYNVSTALDFGHGGTSATVTTGTNFKDKFYKYEFIQSYNDPISPATNTEYLTYIYPVTQDYLSKLTTTNYNARYRKTNYRFNCVHSSYNGDSYYYYGKNKTITRKVTAYLNSYEQVNSYTIATKPTHDAITTTITMSLKPYILLDIDFDAVPSGNTSIAEESNWEDMYCGIYMNPIGTNDIYRLESLDNWTKLSSIQYGDWDDLIADADISLRDHNGYPSKSQIKSSARTQYKYDPNYITWTNYEVDSFTPKGPNSKYGITSILPPVRNFPYDDADVMARLADDDTATYDESLNTRFFLYGCTYESELTNYDGSTYDFIMQYPPDIDGKNEYELDRVMYGCEYTQTDYTTGETITSRASGKPYDYSGGFYCMIPYEYHDKDINVILVNKNNNETPSHVDYKTYYETNGNSGKTSSFSIGGWCDELYVDNGIYVCTSFNS